MKTRHFEARTALPVSAETAFRWHERPGAFERLQPPWEEVRVVSDDGNLRDGSRVVIRVKVGPLWQKWVAVHEGYQPGRQFRDRKVTGPFAHFVHTHRFEPTGPESCELIDSIEYAPPLGPIGETFGEPVIRGRLERMFRYRHAVTRHDLARLAPTPTAPQEPPMQILVSGATGLVGQSLIPFLTTQGHAVRKLVRKGGAPGDLRWNIDEGMIERDKLGGFDAVVHLAGENIAGNRWTPEVKARIFDSRAKGTRLLCEALAARPDRPKVLVCASATGYYGDRADEPLTEDSPPGEGFLPEVCQAWEEACEPAVAAGIRVVNLRFGIVLSPKGSALGKMLLPFKLGLGGPFGSGKQYWSWLSIDDAVGIIDHALRHEELTGPVNAVSPDPVTNREFTKGLAKAVHRPAMLPVPSFAAKVALGEMANDLLLASVRVLPKRLEETGYAFRHPTLAAALNHLLGKPASA